uniref:Uncharacterized protein n=1 Tax=Avena sativa TaxID=4498 RepID=A0ACD5U858_AVESA
MAAAVTRRLHALRVEAPDGHAVADVESGRGASEEADTPVAKRVADAKDDVWVAADEEGDVPGTGRPLLFRTMKVKGSILHPYRFLILVRLIAVVAFFAWRVKHRINHDGGGAWLWATSMVADTWFGFSWLLNQLPKLNPVKRVPDLAALADQHGSSNTNLPGIDVFVTTVDPVDEPILYTVNTILSILAADYPVDRYACYLSDDGGTLVHYEAMVEVAGFAALWVPFCRKHRVEPRSPENYFGMKTRPYVGRMAAGEFVRDHRRVRREYEEFKVRIGSLASTIRQRSHAYNSSSGKGVGARATWMADGTQWPGTWIEQAENHRRGQHAGIVQVILNHPSCKPQLGSPASTDDSPFDFSNVDTRLPMLVYISREKRPGYNHQKKAGAMNVMLRVSALLSNAPFVVNFDCDHYINNSQALRAPMCFMLDPRDGQNTAFVQFPQRFDDVDPTDRYANHNRVFFDGTMLSLNGLQGPSYLGTGTVFRRVALYGMEPPRYRAEKIKLVAGKADEFGSSTSFVSSMPDAAIQERSITPVLVDEGLGDDLAALMTCAYEYGSSWGRDVGWVYNIATEDVVTGFRMHSQGWRSMYCSMEPAAFPRHGADQPHGAPLPGAPVVGGIPGDVLLPQQRAPRRRPAPPSPARRVPQHVHVPDRHGVHPGVQPLPGHVALLRAVVHPEALRRVHRVPRRRHRHDPLDRHVRGEMGGDHAARLVPQRAVLHDRRHRRVPGGCAVHGAEARDREGAALQAHVQADGGLLRRRQVRRPVHGAVGAAADPDRGGARRERRGRRGGGRQGRDVGFFHGPGAARGARDGVQRLDPRPPLPVRARDHGAVGKETRHPVRHAGHGHRRRRDRLLHTPHAVPSRMHGQKLQLLLVKHHR